MPNRKSEGKIVATVDVELAEDTARLWRDAVVDAGLTATMGVMWRPAAGNRAEVIVGRHDNLPVRKLPPQIYVAHKKVIETTDPAAAE
jgi:hypothetical protein